METRLQLHPDVRQLLEEIDLLREEIAHLLAEEYDLIHIVSPGLLIRWQQKLGPWEIKRLEAQIARERARRRLELVQAALNRGQAPVPAEIEAQLEVEFLAWQQRLKEAVARYQQAELLLQSRLTPEQNRELKKLYYALVKKLHPDLNPNLTDEQKRLWQRVQDAYEIGDVEELRGLALLATPQVNEAPAPFAELQQKQAALKQQVHGLLERLEKLKTRPPLSERQRLLDDAWIEARRRELEEEAAQFQAARLVYENKLQPFLSLFAHGKQFGSN